MEVIPRAVLGLVRVPRKATVISRLTYSKGILCKLYSPALNPKSISTRTSPFLASVVNPSSELVPVAKSTESLVPLSRMGHAVALEERQDSRLLT